MEKINIPDSLEFQFNNDKYTVQKVSGGKLVTQVVLGFVPTCETVFEEDIPADNERITYLIEDEMGMVEGKIIWTEKDGYSFEKFDRVNSNTKIVTKALKVLQEYTRQKVEEAMNNKKDFS